MQLDRYWVRVKTNLVSFSCKIKFRDVQVHVKRLLFWEWLQWYGKIWNQEWENRSNQKSCSSYSAYSYLYIESLYVFCYSIFCLWQVCHVILGMKPSSRDDEGRVVKGWLSRELKRGYQLGQTWYLVSSAWWRQWQDYVSDNVRNYCGPLVKHLLWFCTISLDQFSSVYWNYLPINE